MNYLEFLNTKKQLDGYYGFNPVFVPDFLFDFQKSLVDWSVKKGRAAIFADCGLGKTAIQLVWSENVVRKTNKPVLILTPLSVGAQTAHEAEKFSIEAQRSSDGKIKPGARIIITNYERLHKFNAEDFSGVVCDESSILKNFDGVRKDEITEFMRLRPYRLLCTATAAPNDYIELGTSSEALGELGYMDMLSKFFKTTDGSGAAHGGHGGRFDSSPFTGKFRFRGHAERDFWRWVCSWARAIRKPSDIGGDDSKFSLPPLNTFEHVIKTNKLAPGYLIALPAVGLKEQRDERKRTVQERSEKAAELVVGTGKPAVCWCHLNPEGDLIERMIPDCVQVSGSDSDEEKEEKFSAFASGQVRVMVTKPSVAGFGLNWQHCAHQTFFPSHSFEQYYQGVRRCWRFGQENPVQVDIVTSEGEAGILRNLQRKAEQAEKMFAHLVELMNDSLKVESKHNFTTKASYPEWVK